VLGWVLIHGGPVSGAGAWATPAPPVKTRGGPFSANSPRPLAPLGDSPVLAPPTGWDVGGPCPLWWGSSGWLRPEVRAWDCGLACCPGEGVGFSSASSPPHHVPPHGLPAHPPTTLPGRPVQLSFLSFPRVRTRRIRQVRAAGWPPRLCPLDGATRPPFWPHREVLPSRAVLYTNCSSPPFRTLSWCILEPFGRPAPFL